MKKTTAAKDDQTLMLVLAIVLCAAALWAIGCGGGGSSSGTPTTPSGTSTGSVVALTLTANGVSDAAPRIFSGDRVRFMNHDTRTHQILTTPHLIHTDCPALNSIGILAPGQSGTSEPLTSVRGCGFHDHLNPDDNSFRGQVLVGLTPSDPAPPAPGYLRR
jgi:hypothetical protein